VTLFDKSDRIGGQLNMARVIPGKEEFDGLVNWFATMRALHRISLRLNHTATPEDLTDFDDIIIATGVTPRDPAIPGQALPHVASYIDILTGRVIAGPRVVVIGAGGIGFDVAEYLVTDHSPTTDLPEWLAEWGVGDPETTRGGLASSGPAPAAPVRQVTLLQRKPEKPGRGLGKTTGWIHRMALQMKKVSMTGGINYERIVPEGLWVSHGPARDNPELLIADTIVLCAGQLSERSLADQLIAQGRSVHIIGGADLATELDAKRAIDQGMRLAASL
jgi:2,4-dienoyl-CoA reductase (NADPH2)